MRRRTLLAAGATWSGWASADVPAMVRAAEAGDMAVLPQTLILGDGGPAHTEIVRLLVAHGASVQPADAQGVTPLAHAEQRGPGTVAEILRRAGARP